MTEPSIDQYLSGRALYGDDLSEAQIAQWYRDEVEAYADLGAKERERYKYAYHALNELGFRHLPASSFERVLGFGSAYGDELLPVISRARSVTIVEPSGAFVSDAIHGVAASFVKPAPDGTLPFADESFDLITCFGVLHHIPNVSFVVSELARSLKAGGYLLLREPIVSMGDWRVPRPGLTKRERGIPFPILEAIIADCRLTAERISFFGFPLAERLFRFIRPDFYNSRVMTTLDQKAAGAFSWNVNYHARRFWHHLRPTSAFLILRKPAAGEHSSARG